MKIFSDVLLWWRQRDWAVLLLLIIVAATLIGRKNGLWQADHIAYDQLMPALTRPAPSNIVIIKIDDKSIAALGRWPWKRSIHAQLLDILSSAQAKAIGLDIILTESSAEDATLAHAMALNQRTVIPIRFERSDTGFRAILPLPEFTQAAAQISHIHLVFDNDGIIRNVYQNEELDGHSWSQFAALILKIGHPKIMDAPASSRRSSDSSQLKHIGLMRIPFFGSSGHFQNVSYIDALQGLVPPDFFHDKYVLVGATASGLGDIYPTPETKRGGLMPGIELHANILGALQENQFIHLAPAGLTMLFTAFPALLALISYLYLSPPRALLFTVLLLLAVITISYLAFSHYLWIPPTGAILLLILIYPIWSWRRLEAAARYLNDEYLRLSIDDATAPTISPATQIAHKQARTSHPTWDFIERRIDAMRLAAERMRDLHQFVSDTLNSMPDVNLVISNEGILMRYNRKASDLFASLKINLQRGQHIDDLLSVFILPESEPVEPYYWQQQLVRKSDGTTPDMGSKIEIKDSLRRTFLVRSSLSQQMGGAPLGWIVSLADVTSLRANERLREDSLNFISHDMRAPQSSILALLELQRSGQLALSQEVLFNKIEKSVHNTLTLADEFVHLARAQSSHYHLEEVSFSSILADACDEMWALANARGIELLTELDKNEEYWIHLDRPLMVRALCNLLSNAIKYGPANTPVLCRLSIDRVTGIERICCDIIDQGNGIPYADRLQLFTPFFRAQQRQKSDTANGIGLGLAFVKTVVEHHDGTITLLEQHEPGNTFRILLPCAKNEGTHQ